MRWLYVQSTAELKDVAKTYEKNPFKNIKIEIKKDLEETIKKHGYKEKAALDMFKVTSGKWDGLYDRIVIFRDMLSLINGDVGEKPLENKLEVETEREYFKSEEDELIFYILELEGKKRSEKLGINRGCFVNKKEAKKWRNNISKKIHPDKSKNKNAGKAEAIINQLYEEMVGNE